MGALSQAPQPGLRSFIVYDHIPAGCIAFEMQNDDFDPHIRLGDFALIDTNDRDPIHEEFFLIDWKSRHEDNRYELAMLTLRAGRYGTDAGKCEPGFLWFLSSYNPTQHFSLAGKPILPPIRWADGPYQEEQAIERILGRVIGIYQPDFRPRLIG